MSDSPAQSTPLHGSGGLLGTPGLGTPRRKSRKWGVRTKATKIVGNLYRANDGKFSSGGDNPVTATPRRGVVLSKQPKPAARPKPAKVAAPKKGGGKKPAGAKPKDPAVAARQAQRDQEHAEDRAQRQADRAERRAKMQQRERERLQRDVQRTADEAKKKLAAKQPKAGGGGGGKKTPSPEQKRAEQAKQRQQTAGATAGQVGLAAGDLASLRTAAEQGGATSPALSKLGLIGSDGLATDQGRRALSALERGDVRGYNAALQDAQSRMGRETAASTRRQGVEARRNQAQTARNQAATERQARQQRQIERLKRRALSGGRLSAAQVGQLQDAGVVGADGRFATKAETYGGVKRSNLDDSVFAGPDRSFPIKTAQDVRDAVRSLGRTKHDKDAVKRGIIRRARAIGATDALPESWRTKSFVVFKDASGAHRWIARTTTAYRDRDGEIISTDALDRDSQRMTTTKQFGPLRWWHVGQPDPFDTAAPWGPGLDIGDCDYSVVIGRTRIESGTFRSTEIALKMARVADDLEMSPGFFHPTDQPRGGVFTDIRTFERSPVPMRYGRASNLFTGFTVKERRMDPNEMERRFKAMISELKLTPEAAENLAAGLVATEKTAQTQGIAFKSADAPAQPEEITVNGVVYTVKAAPAPPADESAVAIETQADGDMPADDLGGDGDFIGDMSPAAFSDLCYQACLRACQDAMGPTEKMAEMLKNMGDMHGELKSMYGGHATKEAGISAELATLKSQHASLAAKIAQIEGDQPAVVLPDDVAQALKSAGPSAPAEPDDPETVAALNDPSRPFASIAARTMPQLYRNSPDGGFAGWTPPPSQ